MHTINNFTLTRAFNHLINDLSLSFSTSVSLRRGYLRINSKSNCRHQECDNYLNLLEIIQPTHIHNEMRVTHLLNIRLKLSTI